MAPSAKSPMSSPVRAASVSHVLWADRPMSDAADGPNAVFYGDRAIDRRPCGTGPSARLAQLTVRGSLKGGDSFIYESYIGSRFTGPIEASIHLAGRPAIIPSIQGSAISTGFNTISIDQKDLFWRGFSLI
jgi:4-hydroxyproline epimerase